MAWLAGKKLQFFTTRASYLLLIRFSTEKKVGREGQKLGSYLKPFLRMVCHVFCCFLLVTWANPGILWERFLEVKHHQGRLTDSHLPDWKPATSPHSQCDDSKSPHILSATPFLLEQEESYHVKVREGAWVWRPLISHIVPVNAFTDNLLRITSESFIWAPQEKGNGMVTRTIYLMINYFYFYLFKFFFYLYLRISAFAHAK